MTEKKNFKKCAPDFRFQIQLYFSSPDHHLKKHFVTESYENFFS